MKYAKQILSVEFDKIHALLDRQDIDWNKNANERKNWVKRLEEIKDAIYTLNTLTELQNRQA